MLPDLGESILKLLREQNAPLGVRDVERLISSRHPDADTFDVQRAVRALVDEGKAFTDSRYRVAAREA
jgi:predicted Zn-ribbon and HTH transcriptional regulator